ncbi:MAG: SMI1/KNR4 family protein [Hymenobacter sp.]|nr:MAG: SMI1/KNR4 family protein [Hymenobacter sp.]
MAKKWAIPADFWDDSDYFVSPGRATAARVQQAEALLGYRLPAAYLALLRTQNGGTPRRTRFPTATPTSWADDHVALSGIRGLGGQWGIDSPELGSQFMVAKWGYPAIGIVVGECPSAGHDAIMLDYSVCGPTGEPQVIHVDVETQGEPVRTLLAANFSTFLQGLETDNEEDNAEEAESDAQKVATGQFSELLQQLCDAVSTGSPEAGIRRIATAMVAEKGFFALHADALSHLLYDVQFWLYSAQRPVRSRAQYLDAYPYMLVFDGEFSMGGYAPGFVEDWWDERAQQGHLVKQAGQLRFTPAYEAALQQQLIMYKSDL